jgi:cell division septation protein DedD
MMDQVEAKNEISLKQAALLGVAAGLLGAASGWFLMSTVSPIADRADPQGHQPGAVSPPTPPLDPAPASIPDQEAAATQESFYLQLAACRDVDTAQESIARLRGLGFAAQIHDDGPYHLIRVGPLGSQEDIADTSDQLARALQDSPDVGRAIPGPWLTIRESTDSLL